MRRWRKTAAGLLCAFLMTGCFTAAGIPVFAEAEVRQADNEYEEPEYSEYDAFSSEEAEAENNDGDDTYVTNNGSTIRIPRVTDPDERVFDYAGIFTEAQQNELRNTIAELQKKKKCAVILLISSDVPLDLYDGTETSQKYMRQFYIDNDYPEDGVGFIIDLNNRVLWGVGYGEYCDQDFVDFSDNVYEKCLGAARKGDYFQAAKTFLADFRKYKDPLYAAIPTMVSLIISLALSLLTVLSLNLMHKSTQPAKANTPRLHSKMFNTTRHDVNYLGTTVTKRQIPKNDGHGSSGGSGGISSGGFSSGGRSSAGGGGKF